MTVKKINVENASTWNNDEAGICQEGRKKANRVARERRERYMDQDVHDDRKLGLYQ